MAANLFIGIHGCVLAIDRASGSEIWRTKLKGSDFVHVVLEEDAVLASTKGELFCLDAGTGVIRWHNRLRGLGTGLLSIASPGGSALFGEKKRRDAARAAGAAVAAT
jgi:hypothetical protein